MSAGWAVWSLACLLIAYGCWRAARDYDDEPQPPARWDADRQRFHREPADPDRQPGTDALLLATCRHLWHLPDHPNHHTTKGD